MMMMMMMMMMMIYYSNHDFLWYRRISIMIYSNSPLLLVGHGSLWFSLQFCLDQEVERAMEAGVWQRLNLGCLVGGWCWWWSTAVPYYFLWCCRIGINVCVYIYIYIYIHVYILWTAMFWWLMSFGLISGDWITMGFKMFETSSYGNLIDKWCMVDWWS